MLKFNLNSRCVGLKTFYNRNLNLKSLIMRKTITYVSTAIMYVFTAIYRLTYHIYMCVCVKCMSFALTIF